MADEYWSSRLMFILVSAGSAVGIGNIWRFPYIAGENDGGTFLFVYLIFVFLLAIPGIVLEIMAGASTGKPLFAGFRELVGKYWAAGFLPFMINWIILSYYLVITGWVLFYFVFSLPGEAPPFDQASESWFLPVFGGITLLIAAAVSASGIRRGIEKLNLYLFPFFVFSLLFLFLNTLSLEGAGRAVEFLTTVDFDGITPDLILAALTQAIFSLSVGLGIMFTYGEYLSEKEKEKMIGSVGAIAFTDTAMAVISAITIFTITFTFALSPAAGPSLAFDSLPIAFSQMPLGNILMPLFFLMLFCAALTSIVSSMEVMVNGVRRLDGERRLRDVTITVLLLLILFIPAALSYSPVNIEVFGMRVLDFLDGVIVERLAPITTTGMIVVLVWGWKESRRMMESIFSKDLGEFFYLLLKYVLPLVLLIEFI
jgi:NSS family neurotransmitter:Na+ symporter